MGIFVSEIQPDNEAISSSGLSVGDHILEVRKATELFNEYPTCKKNKLRKKRKRCHFQIKTYWEKNTESSHGEAA